MASQTQGMGDREMTDKEQEKMEQIIIHAMTDGEFYPMEDAGEHATEIARALIFNGYRKPKDD